MLLPDAAGMLIDGPGTRELGLWTDEETALAGAFADVEALAAGCRFRDCSHGTEPGCAVRRAVEVGLLPDVRLRSFTKLQRELAHVRRDVDAAARREHRRHERILTLAARHHIRAKRR